MSTLTCKLNLIIKIQIEYFDIKVNANLYTTMVVVEFTHKISLTKY